MPVTETAATSPKSGQIPAPVRPPMPKWLKLVGVVGGVFFLLSAGALVSRLMTPSHPYEGPPMVRTALTPDYEGDLFTVGEFDLVDQNNEPANILRLYKKVTIASFVFSNCPLACPTIVTQLSLLQKDLGDTSVQFALFSIDPKHDTPAALKAWGDKLGVNWQNWAFFTEPGPKPDGTMRQEGRRILTEHLMGHFEERSKDKIELKDGSGTMDNIIHPFEIFLLGPKGELIARYKANRQEDIDALRVRAREADKLIRTRRGEPVK